MSKKLLRTNTGRIRRNSKHIIFLSAPGFGILGDGMKPRFRATQHSDRDGMFYCKDTLWLVGTHPIQVEIAKKSYFVGFTNEKAAGFFGFLASLTFKNYCIHGKGVYCLHFEASVKKGVHVLVVDDELIIRKSIALLLEHDGHEVWQADDGESALAELTKRRFDLVITDFSMPGMHGDELVARIRQLMPEQPIIMITAFVEEFKVFGEAAGRVDALLWKPFSFKELRAAIELVLTPVQTDETDQTGGLPRTVEPQPPATEQITNSI